MLANPFLRLPVRSRTPGGQFARGFAGRAEMRRRSTLAAKWAADHAVMCRFGATMYEINAYWQGFLWDPSRTLPDGPPAPGRPAQLAALGNAVHPQQGALALTTAMRPQQLGLSFTPPTCLESAA